MQHAELLIDKAVKICGSASELARRMGIDRAEVTKLRQETRPLSPELAAELADIAGEDARQAVIDAVIERNRDGKKGPRLAQILGKALAAGVAAMCLFFYSGDSISATKTIAANGAEANVSIHRIYSLLRRLIVRWLSASADADRALAYG